MMTRKPEPVESGQWTVDSEQKSFFAARRILRPSFCWFGGALLVALLMAVVATPRISAQNPQYNGNGFPHGGMQDSASPLAGGTGNLGMEAKRINALNAERQKSLVSDTNKLVKLTSELNAQINGTHPASLTESQLHMVAEIEKLAHNIREKMCTSVRGGQFGMPAPSLNPPALP